MNGFRETQRLSFAGALKKQPGAPGHEAASSQSQAVAVQSVSTSSFRAVLGTTDKTKFAAETGFRADGSIPAPSGAVKVSGPYASVPHGDNVFDMPTERGVTACIPYNHNGARPTGTALFLHGRVEDSRVFGRAPHLRYLDLEEGVRLPACLTDKIERVVVASNLRFDQHERKLPVLPDVCFYDTYEIPIQDEVFRCPVDFNGKVMKVVGTFCSEACVLAYLRDGRAGPRAQQHGATWLAALRRWRNCLGAPQEEADTFIDPALHFSVLQRFGGPMKIEQYRNRGRPRCTYRRHIDYVFPQHFRLVPSGYIHVREDRAQPPQQHTARLSAPTGSFHPPPLAPPPSWSMPQTPIPTPSTSGPLQPPPASPFVLGAAGTPGMSAVPAPRRRLKRRIETSDDEGAGAVKEEGKNSSGQQQSPKTDYYRIRRIEQNQMGRRKRHYQSGDADLNYQRKAVSRRRKRAVAKQLSEPQGALREFFGAAE